jgi:small multidrug resistance pump|tara:strand:- start:693 stop:1028 length:336 start_codon:yes stop_codon:yes gene_type:complete
MKPITGYIFLALAISCGIAANSFAKISDGFSKLTPSVACILLMSVTMYSLAKGMSAIPVGFAYATYSAITVASILIFGIIKYNQIPNVYGLIGITLIIAGVLIVNLLGKVN